MIIKRKSGLVLAFTILLGLISVDAMANSTEPPSTVFLDPGQIYVAPSGYETKVVCSDKNESVQPFIVCQCVRNIITTSDMGRAPYSLVLNFSSSREDRKIEVRGFQYLKDCDDYLKTHPHCGYID